MKIFLADMDSESFCEYLKYRPQNKLCILLSFNRINENHFKILKSRRKCVDILALDSGTFSLTKSRELDSTKLFNEYAVYLKIANTIFDLKFNFDICHGANCFEENKYFYEKLFALGYDVVPVIQDMRDNKEALFYLKNNNGYVALGSSDIQTIPPEKLNMYLDSFYKENIRVHLFGTTREDLINKTHVFSVDSTTWKHLAWENNVIFFSQSIRNKVKFNIDNNGDINSFDDNYIIEKEFIDYIRSIFNFTVKDLVGKKNYLNRTLVNIDYYYNLQNRADSFRKNYFR